MSKLTTVPSSIFNIENDGYITDVIYTKYYRDSVEITQGNNTVTLDCDHIKEFFKHLIKNNNEAQEWFSNH